MKTLLSAFLIFCSSYFITENDRHLNNLFVTCLYQDGIISLDNGLDISQYIGSIDIDTNQIGENIIYSLKIIRFSLGKNDIKIITNDDISILFDSSSCNDFIIAYDFSTKTCYKLKGFNNNDLFFLLRDLNKKNNEKKKVKYLLDELTLITNEVDFKCIYKSLNNLDFDVDCLKSCKSPLPAH